METDYDLVIIGAGMGGSALAFSLRRSRLRILILERGTTFVPEAANWDADSVITGRAYDPPEQWIDQDGSLFTPRVYYTTGGSSKFFGGTSFRFRKTDFSARTCSGGTTEAWPIGYDDLEPFYDQAEKAMGVRGRRRSETDHADPTEANRGPYRHPPTVHEPDIQWLANRLSAQGLHPFPLPIAVHQGPGGRCRKGSPCDGFPCRIRAKGDGENAFLRPALRDAAGRIELRTGAYVRRLVHDASGRTVTHAEVTGLPTDGPATAAPTMISASLFVVAAGAANSAALLLRSKSPVHPNGLGNSSDAVGRFFMAHNNTVLMALSPLRRNPTRFQKTLAVNDYYHDLGNIQMRGKILPQNLAGSEKRIVRLLRYVIARRSFDFWLMSEDLPDPENRVTVVEDKNAGANPQKGVGHHRIRLARRLNNLEPHRELVRRAIAHVRKAGLPIIIAREPSPSAIQHQVGTIRFGDDPSRSALNRNCRSWDVENLYVVDGSVFPSSAAVNPALTIAANALRVGSHLQANVLQSRIEPG